MKPSRRMPVNKAKSAAKFRAQTANTKAANMLTPMRGGWRL